MLKIYVPRQRMKEILQTACASLEGDSLEEVDELHERVLMVSDELEWSVERAVLASYRRKLQENDGRRPVCHFIPSNFYGQIERARVLDRNMNAIENPQYASGRDRHS